VGNQKYHLGDRQGTTCLHICSETSLHLLVHTTNLDPLLSSTVERKEFSYLTSTLLTMKAFMAVPAIFVVQHVTTASNHHSQLQL